MSTELSPAERASPAEGADPTCPLCTAALPEPAERIESGEGGRLVRFRLCPVCRSLVPTDGESPTADEGVDLTDSARRLADGAVSSASTVAWEMAEHLPAPQEAGPIVDLGIGRGGIPNALKTLGYTVTGCEPSAFLSQMARASYLLGPDTLSTTDPDSYLDHLEATSSTAAAVVLWHVIDRHPAPMELLRRCRRLVPGGVLFIELPIPTADAILAEQRFHPTPATVLHLAEELDLVVAAASVAAEVGLRVFYRVPTEDTVDLDLDLDLDRDRRSMLDLPALDAAYRSASPIFAATVPDPTQAPTSTDGKVGAGTELGAGAEAGTGTGPGRADVAADRSRR